MILYQIFLKSLILKNFGKLMVKRKNDLSKKRKHSKYFQKDIVNFIINTNIILKVTYECYQGFINFIKDKDFNLLLTIQVKIFQTK